MANEDKVIIRIELDHSYFVSGIHPPYYNETFQRYFIKNGDTFTYKSPFKGTYEECATWCKKNNLSYMTDNFIDY